LLKNLVLRINFSLMTDHWSLITIFFHISAPQAGYLSLPLLLLLQALGLLLIEQGQFSPHVFEFTLERFDTDIGLSFC